MTEQEFEHIRKLLRRHSGIELKAGKEYLVEARLQPILADLELDSIGALVKHVRSGAGNGLAQRFIEALVIAETSFFRDRATFDALRKQVLPALIDRRRRERRLRIWCAACSTGQEPYSIALLLREYFPELASWHIDLRATDISQQALELARIGRYNQLEVTRGLPASLLAKHFKRHGKQWEIKPEVRALVRFDAINLAGHWPSLPRMDLLLLRNVMIYFDTATKKDILRRVAQHLRPDGYLVLGGAEKSFHLTDSSRRFAEVGSGIYRLKPEKTS